MRVRRLYRARALLLATVFAPVLAGCRSESPPPTPPPTAVVTEAGPSSVEDAIAFLELDAMTHDRKLAPSGSRVHLYTWTTPEQAEELKRTKVLLSRSESPEKGASHYDKAMHDAADAGDPIAKLLRSEGFTKARFAWTTAWPTRMGWPGETYGDVLVTITINASAWIARRDLAAGTWEITTFDGKPIAVADVLAHPEQLAVVHFESDGTTLPGAPRYRELVVCNESQIEGFSFGTANELAELDRELLGLESTAKALRESASAPGVVGSAAPAQMLAAWKDPLPTAPVDRPGKMRRDWLANVAFDNDLYVFEPTKVDAIIASLRAARAKQPTGSYFAGSVRFPGAGAAAPPPTAKPYRAPYYGTYMPPRRKPTGPH